MKLRPGSYKPTTQEDWDAIDYEARLLFTPAAPIDERELFAGRRDKITDLADAVIDRGRHAVLFGERGVGKTSLANVFHLLMTVPTRHIHAIRVQCDPTDNFNSVWQRAFEELTVQEGRENGQRVPLSDYAGTKVVPSEVVRCLGLFMPGELPIVIFDEFDKVADPDIRELMANTIKGLADNSSRATVIIVGVADDVASLVGEHPSVRRHLAQVRMQRMSPDEQVAILDKRIPRLGMTIAANAKWRIVKLSRGLPAYVHQIGRYAALAAISEQKLAITNAHVDTAIESVLKQSDHSCRAEYDAAIRSNRANYFGELLLACALITNTDDSGYFAPIQIAEPLAALVGKRREVAHYIDQLHKLATPERGNVLQRSGEKRGYRFRFRDPMMQPFILMKGVAAKVLSPDAAEIHKDADQPKLSLFPNEP